MMDDTKTIEIASPHITTSLNFEPHSTYFVTADNSGFLRRWNASNGVEVGPLTMKASERIHAVAVSADGRWIVSGGSGNKVTVWNTVTRKIAIEIAEHTKAICALDVSSDSSRFASGSEDNYARIFDITSGNRLVSPLRHLNKVVGVKFSPDGCRIATATHTSLFVGVYNTTSGDKLFEIPVAASYTPITPLAWSKDSQQLFAASPGKITCLDTSTSSRLEWPIHDTSNRTSIVISRKFIVCSAGSSVSFWDPTSRQQIGQIINHATTVNCITISHDARYLACGHDTGITVHRLEGLLPPWYLHAASGGVAWLPCMPFDLRVKVLESWIQGNPSETEAILSHEITNSADPSYDAFATRAFIRTHLGEWRSALEDAERSLQIKQSPIGQIARLTALAGGGEHGVALDELDLVLCDCDQRDTQFLLVINSILLFVCNKRKQAISRLRRFINTSDDIMKDVYLQVLGMMYLKQGDYEDAVQTLDVVKIPFTMEERGLLMAIFMIFDWNFENLKFTACQRLCETLYASGSMNEVGDTLLKIVNQLPHGEAESTHSHILQEIITRSGEVPLLAWTGKPSTCNSCLPSSPAVYAQTQLARPSLEGDQLEKRITELREIVPPADALMTYGSITRSQPVRFAYFRLHLPCIVFHVNSLRREHGNVYHAETVGLGDVEFTTADSLPLKHPRKFVFVNPWIHHLRTHGGAPWKDDDDQGSDVGLNTNMKSSPLDADTELVHKPMTEEAPPPHSVDAGTYTQALELIAHLGQPFNALLLLRQSDGAYKRIASDHEIIVRGVRGEVLRDVCVEVLEIV